MMDVTSDPPFRPLEFVRVNVDDIEVVGVRRAADADKVRLLAESMRVIGLQTPISAWTPDGGETVRLIAGRHRLEAARLLGWNQIECVFANLSDVDRRLWEISENLHRAELTDLERKEHIAEWVRLTEERKLQSAQVAPVESKREDRRGHRPESGINAAVRELGIDRTEAQRAVKIAGLAPEAKEAARDLHLDDNQSALLKAARLPGKEDQIHSLREHAAVRSAPRPQPPARDPLNDFETVERQVDALMAAWNRAGPEAREKFLAAIDAPVADNISALCIVR